MNNLNVVAIKYDCILDNNNRVFHKKDKPILIGKIYFKNDYYHATNTNGIHIEGEKEFEKLFLKFLIFQGIIQK